MASVSGTVNRPDSVVKTSNMFGSLASNREVSSACDVDASVKDSMVVPACSPGPSYANVVKNLVHASVDNVRGELPVRNSAPVHSLPVQRFGSIGFDRDRLWALKICGSPDVQVGALVDSGSVTCVVSPALLDKLGNVHKFEPCGPYATEFSVSGIEVLITSCVVLSLECPIFGKASWKFYVLPNCTSDLVIGLDFLKVFDGSHRYKTDTLKFRNAPSGPGKKVIKLRSLAVAKPSEAFRAESSDSSDDDEGETVPKVTVKPITEDDHEVLDYYMNLNKLEAANSIPHAPAHGERLPKRVATKRPFKVRGLHMHKVPVVTDSDYTGDVILEANEIWMQRCGLISEPGVVTIKNGVGYTWVANPNTYPVVLPTQLKFAACHIVVNKEDKTEVNVEQSAGEKSVLTEEEIGKFNFGPNLSVSQRDKIINLLNKYRSAFAWADSDLTGITDSEGNIIEAKVQLTDNVPVDIKPRRSAPEAKKQVAAHMARELENGWIELSQSAYGAPVLIVYKKDGTTRPVIDYREVNKKCGIYSHPIPDLQDSLDSFRGCDWFCTLDAQDAFKQIWLHKDSREILAFSTNEAKYQPLRLPFGFRNSGTIFQAVMSQILAKYNVPWLVNYIDDNAFGAQDFNELCKRLEKALGIMVRHNIKLKPTKCSFGFNELEYLGHLVSKKGIRIDPERVKEIVDLPVPKDQKGVRSFLGIIGFFRRHIWRYATLAVPLYRLLEDDVEFEWGKAQQIAFECLKKAITTAPILASPGDDGDVEIFCDASDKAIGGVLLYNNEKKRHPVAFYSQKLKKNELNWTVTQKECFSIVRSLEKFRNYIWGREIKVFSDHHSLQWLLDLKDPSARLARWLERIAPYNIKIYHVPGKANCVADELSRLPIRSFRLKGLLDVIKTSVGPPISVRAAKVVANEDFDSNINKNIFTYCDEVKKESFCILQRSDPILKKIIDCLKKSEADKSEFPGKYSADYALVDEVLYKANFDPDGPLWLLVIPAKLHKKIFEEIHCKALSHLSLEKTYYTMKRNYYWPDMYRDIRRMIHT